ncbi:hypothetical protein WDW89_23375 [Deltaproteobacteria bacterium TL4]
MWNFFQKLQRKLSSTPEGEVSDYKQSCEQLIQKYEHLLQQISDYMHSNQHILHTEVRNLYEINRLEMNTFSFFSIKDELSDITSECEILLNHGNQQLQTALPQSHSVKILISQLKELRKYSDQIEGALQEFEEKLLKMEEVLASRTLAN